MAKKKVSPALKWIVAEAKRLQKKDHSRHAWSQYIKEAGKAYRAKGHKKVGAPKKVKYRQTGKSNKKRDVQRKAKAPGKRTVNKGKRSEHTYTERRKNRSDMPGQLTGAASYNYVILSRMNSTNTALKDAESRLRRLQENYKSLPRSAYKNEVKGMIKSVKKYISTTKKELTMLKRLLK